MNQDQQIHFVNQLLEAIRKEIVTDIRNGKTPDNWDGIELRWLVAERANQCSRFCDKRRKREYDNTVIVNNL